MTVPSIDNPRSHIRTSSSISSDQLAQTGRRRGWGRTAVTGCGAVAEGGNPLSDAGGVRVRAGAGRPDVCCDAIGADSLTLGGCFGVDLAVVRAAESESDMG